jgi:hypothetical protein
MLNEIVIHVKLGFLNSVLGTNPFDPDLYRRFIADKNKVDMPEEEIEAVTRMLNDGADVESELQRNMTVFLRDANGNPCLKGYQFKGFAKEAQKVINDVRPSSKLTAYLEKIATRVRVHEVLIPLTVETLGINERPLRAATPQGPRTAIARSEEAPVRTTCEFHIGLLDPKMVPLCFAWLNYGIYYGLGQWRSAGHGQFAWKLLGMEVPKEYKDKVKGPDYQTWAEDVLPVE